MRLWLHLVAHGYRLGRIGPSQHHQDRRHEATAQNHRSAAKEVTLPTTPMIPAARIHVAAIAPFIC